MEYLFKRPFLFLCLPYAVTRLTNLTLLPIFNDESIYLDWGWRSLHTRAGLFFSLHDAKPPFLIWVFGMFETILPFPLFAGRLVSVLIGFLTLFGIYHVSKSLFEKMPYSRVSQDRPHHAVRSALVVEPQSRDPRMSGGFGAGERQDPLQINLSTDIARLSSLIYILIPIFLFFDRQALMESAVSAVGVWSFYFLLQLLNTRMLKYALLLGTVLGLGVFIKLSVLIFLVTSILILVYTLFFRSKRNSLEQSRLFNLIFVTVLVSQVVLLPLYLQHTFWQTLNTNTRFVGPSMFPAFSWIKNAVDVFVLSFWHLTPFVFLLTIYGVYLFFKRKNVLLPVYFLMNSVFVVLTVKSITPRYTVSFLPFASLFAAYAFYSLVIKWKSNSTISLLGITILTIPASISFLLIFFPLTYFNLLHKLTSFSDKAAYVTSWTSGYGIEETIHYLKEESISTKINVAVRLDAGNPESAMFAYFHTNDRITPMYLDAQIMGKEILTMDCLKTDMPIYG